MADLDPITVDITRYKLDGIAGEMQSTLLRSSFSPIVREGLDASAALGRRLMLDPACVCVLGYDHGTDSVIRLWNSRPLTVDRR